MSFTHYKQPDQMDCGTTSLRMVAKHYGKTYSLPDLRQATQSPVDIIVQNKDVNFIYFCLCSF